MTTRTQHTPGPWEVRPRGRNLEIGPIGKKGLSIVELLFSQDSEEGRANAALVAAAPSLLAELESFVAWVSEFDDEAKMFARQIRNAKAVINHAKGRA